MQKISDSSTQIFSFFITFVNKVLYDNALRQIFALRKEKEREGGYHIGMSLDLCLYYLRGEGSHPKMFEQSHQCFGNFFLYMCLVIRNLWIITLWSLCLMISSVYFVQ